LYYHSAICEHIYETFTLVTNTHAFVFRILPTYISEIIFIYI
jgi:hypothetical protein